MWILFAFASAIFAAFTAILSKVGIKDIDSNVATAFRTGIVLVFSWLMVLITGTYVGIAQISNRTMLFLILSGIATGASWLCYFRALQLGDINKVTPVDKSSTILTIILAAIFLHEDILGLKTIQFSSFSFSLPLKTICLVLIGIGTYLMINKKKLDSNAQNDSKHSKLWLIYALFSAVFASLTSILGKVGIEGVNSNLGTAIRTIVVLIMAWIVVFVTKKQSSIKKIDKKSMTFLSLSGCATGGSWLCYYRALQTGPASVVVPIDKLSILLTIGFSYMFFKEKLNVKSALGLALITGGTLLLLV